MDAAAPAAKAASKALHIDKAASKALHIDTVQMLDKVSVQMLDKVEPAQGASLQSSIVNMANTIMGVGLLALPRAFAHSGIVWGLLLTTFAALLNVFTCHLIAECQSLIGRPSTFRQMADRAVPYFSIVIDLSVLILTIGTSCSYLIVATDCFQYAAGTPQRWIWTLLSLAIVAPLSFLRSMDSLKFSSLAAVLILLCLTGVILLFAVHAPNAPLIDACGGPDAHNASCPPGPVEAARPPVSTLSAFSSLSLAFSCQVKKAAWAFTCRA